MKSAFILSMDSMHGLGRIGKIDSNLKIYCINNIMISSGAHPDIPTALHEVYSDLDVFHRTPMGLRWYQLADWVKSMKAIYPSFDKGESICGKTILFVN